jgi:hypothetical protein
MGRRVNVESGQVSLKVIPKESPRCWIAQVKEKSEKDGILAPLVPPRL